MGFGHAHPELIARVGFCAASAPKHINQSCESGPSAHARLEQPLAWQSAPHRERPQSLPGRLTATDPIRSVLPSTNQRHLTEYDSRSRRSPITNMSAEAVIRVAGAAAGDSGVASGRRPAHPIATPRRDWPSPGLRGVACRCHVARHETFCRVTTASHDQRWCFSRICWRSCRA